MSCNNCATQATKTLTTVGVPSGQVQATWAMVHQHLPRCQKCGRFLSPRNPVCTNLKCKLVGEQQGEPRTWPPAGVAFTTDVGKVGEPVTAYASSPDADTLSYDEQRALDAAALTDEDTLSGLAQDDAVPAVRRAACQRLEELGVPFVPAEDAMHAAARRRPAHCPNCGAFMSRSRGVCRNPHCSVSPLYKVVRSAEVDRALDKGPEWLRQSDEPALLAAVVEECGADDPETQDAVEASVARLVERGDLRCLSQDAMAAVATSGALPDWQRMPAMSLLENAEPLMEDMALNPDNSLALQRHAVDRISDQKRLAGLFRNPDANRLTSLAALGRLQDDQEIYQAMTTYPHLLTPAAASEAVGRMRNLNLLAAVAMHWEDIPFEARERAVSQMDSWDRLRTVREAHQLPGGNPKVVKAVEARMEQLARGEEAPASTSPAPAPISPAWRTMADQGTVTVGQWSQTRKRTEYMDVQFDPSQQGSAVVKSESGNQYVVTGNSCNCPQYKYRRHAGPCRHMQAVAEAAKQAGPEAEELWQQMAPDAGGTYEASPPPEDMPTHADEVEPESVAEWWIRQREEADRMVEELI
jgi:hypothetical protein